MNESPLLRGIIERILQLIRAQNRYAYSIRQEHTCTKWV